MIITKYSTNPGLRYSEVAKAAVIGKWILVKHCTFSETLQVFIAKTLYHVPLGSVA